MHIEYLYYFRDFSKTLSISKTAANYFMTPQGLSRAIHQLEKDFGVELMSYQGNSSCLTPAGHALAERIDPVTELIDELRGHLATYKFAELPSSDHVVRVTATSCVSQYVVTFLDLQKPGLFPFGVKLGESSLYRIVPQITPRPDGDAMGIISFPDNEKYREVLNDMLAEGAMIYRPLFTSPLVALVSTYSPLAKKESICPDDIGSYPVARFQDSVLGDALDDYIKEDNVQTVTNAQGVVHAQIMDHQAIGFAPKLIEGNKILPERIVTKPTKGFFQTEFGLLLPVDVKCPECIEHIVEHIDETIQRASKQGRYARTYELI